jgi:hypothetical protein
MGGSHCVSRPFSVVWPSSHLLDCGLAARNHRFMCSSLADRRVASNFGQATSICVPRLCNIAQFPRTVGPVPEPPHCLIRTHVQHPACYGSNVLRREVESSRCAGYCTPRARRRAAYPRIVRIQLRGSGAFQCWEQNFGEPMSRQILNGWKEISNHIERGVRTAQRWESLLGMPVHRPALKDRSSVVAFSDELDGWLSRSAPDSRDECLAVGGKEENNRNLVRVLDGMSTLIRQTRQLICHMKVLQESRRRPARIHRLRIESRARVHTPSTAARGVSLLIFPRRKRSLAGRLPHGALPIADPGITSPLPSEKARGMSAGDR